MASTTDATTYQDHTKFNFETTGSNGALKLIQVFIEYLLSPMLTVI